MMAKEKTKMDEFREDFKKFMEEEGFNETVNDDINYVINNCGVEFGKFAWMRKEFLEENHWSMYFKITAPERKPFIKHFQEIDRRAGEMYERLLPEYLEKYKDEVVARSAVEEVIIKEVVEDTSFTEEDFNTKPKPIEEWTIEELNALPF